MLTAPQRPGAAQGGFSLIELALSMLILALVLGSLLRPIANQIEQQKYQQTEKDLEEIRQALYGFAMANGRLPRPALSELDGREAADCGETPACAAPLGVDVGAGRACEKVLACNGFVPYATLGVGRADAHGKLFMYSVTRRFTEGTPKLKFSDEGLWTIQTRMSSDPGRLVNLAEKVVAVVRSFGARNFGRSIHGSNIANDSGTNIDEIFNSGIAPAGDALKSLTYRFRLPSTQENPAYGGPFDDQMIWIPTSLYMRQMVQAGRLP